MACMSGSSNGFKISVSMGHQLAAGRLTEEIARHPAQNPLPQLSVAEGASDDEVGGFLLCERFELDGRAVA